MNDAGFFIAVGTITGRTPDTDNPTPAGSVFYSARGVDWKDQPASITGTAPMRAVDPTEEIHPAKLNSPCVFGRVGARTFLIVAERPAIEPCQETP